VDPTVKKAFFIGFTPWKNHIVQGFPDFDCRFIGRKTGDLWKSLWPLRILFSPRSTIFVWAFKYPYWLRIFCKFFRLPFYHVEDGFVRSISLGGQNSVPSSLTIDSRTLYFDARKPSDLEVLLSSYDFGGDAHLVARAEHCINLLLSKRISKYNLGKSTDPLSLYGPKTQKRILVIGQVETDASIAFGCDRDFNNNDLVRLAAAENAGAQIIYKPHPEILHRTRPEVSDPRDVAHLCYLLTEDISVADALETIDHVYTITSLLGFEALMRGKVVTCVGLPFYAGWGLTDDRQRNERRTRKLTVQEVFAGSYLLYSRYFDPETGIEVSFETAVTRLHQLAQIRQSSVSHR
jgi:capsular polysaccharide export protein